MKPLCLHLDLAVRLRYSYYLVWKQVILISLPALSAKSLQGAALCRVLQPYTKEELHDMHQQGDIDMGVRSEDPARQQAQGRGHSSSSHDRVFVPKVGWVDQTEADLEGQILSESLHH